jgi:two-component system, response regulator
MNRRTILLVEDNEDDVELARYALGRCRVPTEVVAMPSGEAALEYLRRSRTGVGEDRRPDLVLLDLQLPGISGLEVLRRVRAEPDIRRTLIVVLTTSDDQRDITASYDLGVNSYIRKPVDLGAFTAVVDQLGSYWLQTNTSPPQ